MHIYMHLIDEADTVNARFVWKRVDEDRKKKSKALTQAWSVAKAIRDSDFAAAFKFLGTPVADEDKSGFIEACEQLR